MSKENFLRLTAILILSISINGAIISSNNKNEIEKTLDTEIPVYSFKCESLSGFCYIQELNLNKTHPYFTPISSIPAEKVKIIHLGGHPIIYHETQTSVMHTLTSNLCETFPNLKIIDARYLHLHEIQQDALRGCTNLEAIDLGSNSLQEIDQNVFKYNKNLEKIRLEDNDFTKIHLNIFGELRHLNELGFDGQLLRNDFHVNQVRHRGILKLVVRFNDRSVIDLDEMGISESFPHLSSFIPCYRDQASMYIRFIESTFEPFAKLYCFERPGNLNQENGQVIGENDEVDLMSSITKNTID